MLELAQVPLGNLGDNVVECGLEASGGALGNGVGQLRESVSESKLGGSVGKGVTVALEARAEERERRGLTSMTRYSRLSGLRAY